MDDPRLAPASAEGGATRFTCDTCGASLRWDPTADALLCEHCGSTEVVPRADERIVERALDDVAGAARGLGLEQRVARCDECGARVGFDDATTATHCVYCGSPKVLEQAANRNALRPESLVPLDVDRAAVEQAFTRWIGRLWFRPNALKRCKASDARGLYVPFWTFDAHVHSDWSADAGYHYYVTVSYTVTVNGKTQHRTRQERRTRWEPAWGQRDDVFDDVLVPASTGLHEELLAELGGFDTTALVPYRPEYLAGWHAEEYQLDLEQGWQAGRGLMETRQRARCSGDVPGDTQRNLRVSNTFDDVRWKHVLLPVWSVAYSFRGKVYPVLVNGQSGRVVGEAPLSWVKILLAVLGVGAAVAGVALAQA